MDKNWSFGKNCRFVPKNVHLVPKKQKCCTFYTKNEVFAKEFHQNVQILDKNWSFVPKNSHLVWKKLEFGTQKTIVLFTLKMKFLPKNLTKMFKFG